MRQLHFSVKDAHARTDQCIAPRNGTQQIERSTRSVLPISTPLLALMAVFLSSHLDRPAGDN